MKRSEVLKLIQGLFEVGADFDSATRAENILANLEEIGMLPPLNDSNAAYEEAARKKYAYWEPEHEWEPEDAQSDLSEL